MPNEEKPEYQPPALVRLVVVVEQLVKQVESFSRVEQQVSGKEGLSERTAVLEQKVGMLSEVVKWCVITFAGEVITAIVGAAAYAIYYAVSHK